MKFFNLFACVTIVSLVHIRNAEAQTPTPSTGPPPCIASDLPTFKFLLTDKSLGESINLCEQNKGYCTTTCGSAANAPMNFCNATTMGWGCGCLAKLPDFQGYQWPINYAHCMGSGEACNNACQANTTALAKRPACFEACSCTYSRKCGTPDQPPAYYNTTDITTPPTYGPPTTSNGNGASASGSSPVNTGTSSSNPSKNSASSLAYPIVSAISALTIVAVGMMML